MLLILAVFLDIAFGEPRLAWHPVVWVGKAITFLEKGGHRWGAVFQFIYGFMLTILVITFFTAISFVAIEFARDFGAIVYAVIGAFILKPTFCIKQQWQVALKVRRFFSGQSLKEPQELEKLFSTVDDDGNKASEEAVISASIRSLAENAGDFVVAPLFYFLLFGIPGAVAYRVVNTLDSMLGHHGRYEYLGKFAARLDDVLNFIPARLTALLFLMAAFFTGKNSRKAWQVAARDHYNTSSPNAGWPMSVMAGALGVRLSKEGHYVMGEAGGSLTTESIDGSLELYRAAMLVWAGIILAVFLAGLF